METLDNYAMNRALLLAQKAAAFDEVPVGAVIVYQNKIIGEGFNQREGLQQAAAHAEMCAIESACHTLGSWRLKNCHLFVTLEPCIMCAGAIYQSRVESVTFGANDPKAGAMGSLYSIHKDQRLNHRVMVNFDSDSVECSHILKRFFQEKRKKC